MNVLIGLFIFGCFVAAVVGLGIVFAMALIEPEGPDRRSAAPEPESGGTPVDGDYRRLPL